MTFPPALPTEDGQVTPVAPPELTAPPEPEPAPAEEIQELVVERERFQVPKETISRLAQATGRSEADMVRVLQTGMDHSRIYAEQRSAERELARRSAEIEAEKQALSARVPSTAPTGRPKVEDDPVAFWAWTADRLEKLDQLDKFMSDFKSTYAQEREARTDAEQEAQFFTLHEEMMEQKRAEGQPVVDARTLAATIDYYGIDLRPGLSLSDMMEAGYRIASWGVPAATTVPSLPRPRAVPPRQLVPRASGGAPPATGPQPGETIEQRRERLLNSEVAGMTMQQIHALENGAR